MKKDGWIFPYIKQNKKLIIITVCLGFLTVLAATLLMFTSGYLISKSATRPETILMVYVPIVAVRAFSILRAVSRYLERLMGHNVILKILSKMRLRLYKTIEPKVLIMEKKFRTGDILGVLADDIEHIQDVYLKTIFPCIVGFLLYLFSILVLGFFSWEIAALVAVYLFILVVLVPAISFLMTRSNMRLIKKGRNNLYQLLTDAILGISDWVFSGRQNQFIDKYEERENELYRLERKRRRFTRIRNFCSQLMVAGLVLIVIFWTTEQSENGLLAVTLIAGFVLVVFPITEVFLPLSDAVSMVPRYQDSLERLEQLDDKKGTDKNGMNATIKHEEKEEVFTAERLKLVFDQVQFTYKSGKKAITDVSFTLDQGDKLVLLGPSGSGKSTILKLIQGVIYPTNGKVTINNLDTYSFDNEISNVVSVLNQKPHLFDTTVMNNIRLGKRSATDDEVYWAAKQVELYDYIKSLPEGFQSPLHESGVRFSGGERQRIALARILLQDTPIVILDEPTIGLDPRTERDLLEKMFQVLQGKTILFITHNLAGIKRDDQVAFLDDGQIVMRGQHKQLLAENPRYQKLNQ
ncbi:thiol reductant ABC exporter subunit CydC [Bacillus sp. B15-48]|uniref:thiol reductant ABC exporter subunit CydC n=1 Tax=Bacillus sp. B15-48 TaxID=1548601 RepID=UPI00193F63B0|nr:thiol reductant ABC exporter subunit CydC [Bacillus sp. B15-48]MBM4762816.1 thiol reductant ABC exporter subunit CydC [Bacillus sp. B15-48]